MGGRGHRGCAVAAALLFAAAAGAQGREGPYFYPDDPLLVDDDRLDTPDKPAEVELSDIHDLLKHSFGEPGSPERGEAGNVNTLDEVPDSSWYTNRHARRRLSEEELARGPDRGEGPTGRWTVVKGKSAGVTPGFEIVDERGDRYVIKADFRLAPELASSAEAIVARLLHALGYNVPEVYVVRFSPDELAIREGATLRDEAGDEVAMTRGRLEALLRQAAREEDGRVRGVASRFVPGELIGPFQFYGTRSDDPNDVVPHEDRRELRGLRLFAAWLNHDDSRAGNTLDAWVEEEGRHFVRHYLIDFGSALGAGLHDLRIPNVGYHYFFEGGLMAKNVFSLGLYTPKYRRVAWPYLDDYPSVGRYQVGAFDPAKWKSRYQNPAFLRMTDRDGFWAAKVLMGFTAEELRAVVRTGELGDPEAEHYLWRTMLERQRLCGEAYLTRLNPLDAFAVTGGALTFVNLAEAHGFEAGASLYRARWFTYDNERGRRLPTGAEVVVGEPRLVLPEAPDEMLSVEVTTLHERHPAWARPVRVYLRREAGGHRVVGIER